MTVAELSPPEVAHVRAHDAAAFPRASLACRLAADDILHRDFYDVADIWQEAAPGISHERFSRIPFIKEIRCMSTATTPHFHSVVYEPGTGTTYRPPPTVNPVTPADIARREAMSADDKRLYDELRRKKEREESDCT
jgi:hypothetical protein